MHSFSRAYAVKLLLVVLPQTLFAGWDGVHKRILWSCNKNYSVSQNLAFYNNKQSWLRQFFFINETLFPEK